MLELFREPDANKGADWLELSSLHQFPQPISKSVVVEYLSQNFDEYELHVSDIFKNIEWRSAINPQYPFEIGENFIIAKSSFQDSLEYSFPLLLSTHDFFPETEIFDWNIVGDLFELYCASSLQQQIGNSILIGNNFGGLPSDFDVCLTTVCEIMNERKGPKHMKASDFQDAGVDIIAYKNFDQRKGQIVLLVQCASGKNWYKKGGDIKPKLWSELIFWNVDPIKSLTFPFAYDFDSPRAEVEWIYSAYDAGLLLDRLRLSFFSSAISRYDLSPIHNWIKTQLNYLDSYIL